MSITYKLDLVIFIKGFTKIFINYTKLNLAFVFILLSIAAKSSELKVSGYLYYYNETHIASSEKLIFTCEQSQFNDTVYTDSTGYFELFVLVPDDIDYTIEVYSEDCIRSGNSEPLYVIDSNSVSTPVELQLATCSSSFTCKAKFSAKILDDQSVQFIDSSLGAIKKYRWDFGDGSISNEPSPKHLYFEPNDYVVRLLLTSVDNSLCWYSDTINIDGQNILYGVAYLNTQALDSGKVFYYEDDHTEYFNYNETVVSIKNSRFVIKRERYPRTLIKVKPQFALDDEYYPVYFPTYYGGKFYWDNGVFVNTMIKDSVSISLIKRTYVFYGYGSIKGKVNIPEYPVINREAITVFLLDEYGQRLLKYCYINDDNAFEFNHVPMGNYQLFFDAIRFNGEQLPITLEKSNPNKVIEYKLGENVYTSVDNQKVFAVNVFPNPFNDQINIKMAISTPYNSKICITDLFGKEVYAAVLPMYKKSIRINMGNLYPGLYLLKINGQTLKIYKD